VVKISDIFDMRDKMVGLKHNGKALRDALDGILSARKQHQEQPRFAVTKGSKGILSKIKGFFI